MRGILLDIEISGCKVPMDGKIQKVYDNGLVLCETDGAIVDLASCEEMKGKTYDLIDNFMRKRNIKNGRP